jgi:hypothetical protein
MQNSKFGNALSTIGVVGGLFYGMKKNKSIGTLVVYGALFGVAGMLLGNSISKFYED